MILRRVIFLAMLSCIAPRICGQVPYSECQAWCSTHMGFCHALKSRAFLDVSHYGKDSCGEAALKAAGPLSRHEQLTRSLEELRLAAADPEWVAQQGADLPFEIALLEELIGRDSLASNELLTAAKFLDSAAGDYQKAFEGLANTKGERGQYYVLKAVLGLLRCGRLTAALAAAQSLEPADADRSYITAEILFRSGEQENAAEQYEKWIRDGCLSSDFPVISYDEFGPQILGVHKEDMNRPLCERLPSELRGRLDDLKQKFGHPRNLPLGNFPPLYMGR